MTSITRAARRSHQHGGIAEATKRIATRTITAASAALVLMCLLHAPAMAQTQQAPKLSALVLPATIDTANKFVWVDFWATWCPPCITTLPALNTVQQQYPDDLLVIAVSVDVDPILARNTLNDLAADLTFVHDLGLALAMQMGVQGFPTGFLFDPNGTLVEVHNAPPFADPAPFYASIIENHLQKQRQ
ncbi:MAG: TlpA family protein disulfide reductase [Alphaproteobacteria bacterium]|nr:TlpA family protein disulfide reductase [Alphaproteobacteria bacterium]